MTAERVQARINLITPVLEARFAERHLATANYSLVDASVANDYSSKPRMCITISYRTSKHSDKSVTT